MKKRFFTLLALFLSVGLAAPACGGDDDDNKGDDDDGDNGSSGSGTGGSGTGGSGNNGSGTGGSGTGGSGTGGSGTGGSGTGGSAGGGGTGGSTPGDLEPVYELSGGDIDAEDKFELTPFGVAIAGDGTVFVSTLGNNDDVLSAIYKFEPGSNGVNPTLYFQAKNKDTAVYGLALDNKNRLHACISQHVLNANGATNASVYRFDNLKADNQIGTGFVPTTLQTQAVTNGNSVVDNGANIKVGRCANLGYDGGSVIYVPDSSGDTQFIFRVNTEGTTEQVQTDDNGNVVNADDLRAVAWFTDAATLGGGNVDANFGATGVTADAGSVKYMRNDDNLTIFDIGINGFGPDDTLETETVNAGINQVLYMLSIGGGEFLVSARNNNDDGTIFRLSPDGNGNFDPVRLQDENTLDDDAFSEPAGIAISGDQGLAVGSQIEQLGVNAVNPSRVFRFNVPQN
jgi:hypothetical protein